MLGAFTFEDRRAFFSPGRLISVPETRISRMSRAGNIELYHGRTEVDMALSGKAGTAKVRSSAGKKSAQT
jgi:hypothetical protein